MSHTKDALFLRSVIDHIEDPVFVKDESHVWVLVNEAFARLIGVEANQLIGKTDYDFLNKKDSDIYWEKDSEVFSTGKLNVNIEPMVGKDGVERIIKTKKTLLELDDAKYLVGVITEITQERKLTRALEESEKKAVLASKSKSDFLANMSHELRTPIHSVVSFTNLLLEDEQDEEKIEMLEAVSASGKLLGGVIDDILDISRIEAGKQLLYSDTVNINSLIEKVIKTTDPLLRKNNNTIFREVDNGIPAIVGDEIKIQQILTNLVSNSAKFTQNGFVRVRVKVVELRDEKVSINFSVSDNGKGIEHSFMEELFEKFTQEDAVKTKNRQGSGLGLAIVKSYVELMGGRVAVVSNPIHGTTFSFNLTFNVARGSITPATKQRHNFANLGHLKILVAEDNELNQLLIKKVLGDKNIQLDIVANGLEAVKYAQANLYDAVILDVHMPIMDGLEAFEQIKKINCYRETPIIVLTANVTTEIKVEVNRLGGIYCSKPMDTEVLFDALQNRKIVKVKN